MPDTTNRRILLKSRPVGEPAEGNFALDESPVPEPGEGQFLGRTIYLSLDPYMRGRMSAGRSYASPAEVDRPMVGATVGQVATWALHAVHNPVGDGIRDVVRIQVKVVA